MIIHHVPSKDCKYDWDYMEVGNEWECNCNEGREQSPIDLPPTSLTHHIE